MEKTMDAEYCVTCPKCGKLHQKCRVTDALIVCPRCGHQYRALVKDGMLLSMSAAEDTDLFFSQIRQLAYERENHRPLDVKPNAARPALIPMVR